MDGAVGGEGAFRMIRVLLADDHPVVRHGLKQLLTAGHGIAVVGMAVDGRHAVALARELRPDVVLMDLVMPGLDGVRATQMIVTEHPGTRVVVLTSYADQARILDALNAGAQGYLLKHAEPAELVHAVHSVHAGHAPLDARASRVLLDEQRRARPERTGLSQRERTILELVSRGMANKQVARRLGITERTVKSHLTKIFAQIGVAGRVEAALWARENLH
jgi:DNA-binding NarL/FixJ family response regulator